MENNEHNLKQYSNVMLGFALMTLLMYSYTSCSRRDNQPCSNQTETDCIKDEKKTKQDHWKAKFVRGNAKEQSEALVWFHDNFLQRKMTKAEVERTLGMGIRVAGVGDGYLVYYFTSDLQVSLNLWYEGSSPESQLLQYELHERAKKRCQAPNLGDYD